MAASARHGVADHRAADHCPAGQPGELTELRLLMELSALRRLADRGLSDQEYTLVKKLADDTVRPARRGDVPGYLRADTAFHLHLLDLAGEPALADIARLLLAAGPRSTPPGADPGHLLAREAREHRELAGLLADGMVSAADQLLRLHLGRPPAGRAAPTAGLASISCAGA
jgi:DNA-binding GntR family transcriptional regulator